MDPDLREALETLHDFRQFWSDQVTQTRGGGSHHNPMWARIVAVLDKHGMNENVAPGGGQMYFHWDPAYRERL